MNLNEAKQLLNDNGYAIDEGIGNFVKKARRAVFGKNKDDEDILAKRKARQAQQAETHADDEKQREGTLSASDNYTSDVLRYLQDREEFKAIYDVLVKLRKKYGKYIVYSNALTPHRIRVGAIYQDNYTSKEMAGKYSDRNGGKYTSTPVDRKQYSFCQVGEIGLYATDRFNYTDRTYSGHFSGDSDAHMRYATSVQNAMNKKYTETDDLQEWAVEISDIVNEIVNAKSKDAANDWEQNIDQNESVKIKQALKYLRENGYQINEDLPAKDQDAFQWRTFRKDANKILAGFAAKFIELAATELVQESGEAVDMNELWDSVGGKDEFIKTLITDENEVLLDYVGELWQAANNAKNLNIK